MMRSPETKAWLRRHRRSLVASVFALTGAALLVGQAALAQSNFGFTELNGNLNLGNVNLVSTIARIINIFLGFLGVIAIGLILYAGFLWLTSRGDQEKISQAKRVLSGAVVGLAIIFAAFGIASFIINQLKNATGTGNGTGGPPVGCVGFGCTLPGSNSFTVTGKAPQGTDVPLCAAVQAVFSQNIDPATIQNSTITIRDSGGNILSRAPMPLPVLPATTNAVTIPKPPEFTPNTDYNVTIPNSVKSVGGTALASNVTWSFTTGNTDDNSLPQVAAGQHYPVGPGVCRNTSIGAEFTKVMAAATLNNATIILTDQANNQVPLTSVTVDSNFKKFAVYPRNTLLPGQTYKVTLKTPTSDTANDGIRDSCMNPLDGTGGGSAADHVWTFTTGDIIDCSPTIVAVDKTGGYYGDHVKITGENLGFSGAVAFNNTQFNAGAINSWGASTCSGVPCQVIDVTLPNDDQMVLPPHPGYFSVWVSGKQSNLWQFKLLSPYISEVSPNQGPIGQFVTISGYNFGNSPGTVRFVDSSGTGYVANTPSVCTGLDGWRDGNPGQIIVAVPTGVTTGLYRIEVTDVAGNKGNVGVNTNFTVNTNPPTPGICNLSAPACSNGGATPVAELITGTGFGTSGQVQFAGQDITTFASPGNIAPSGWGNQSISFNSPQNLSDNQYPVTVVSNGRTSNPYKYFNVPCQGHPQVNFTQQCASGLQSPSPWPDSTNVCTNAQISVQFNQPMQPASFTTGAAGTVSLKDCGTVDASACTTDVALTNLQPISGSSGITGFTIDPGVLTQGHWYAGILKGGSGGVSAATGTALAGDYSWQFKTSSGPCEVASVNVNPPLHYFRQPGDAQAYSPRPNAANCNVLSPAGYTWDWYTTPVSSPAVSLSANQTSGPTPNISVTAQQQTGSTPVYVNATIDGTAKSGQGKLFVDALACNANSDCVFSSSCVSQCVSNRCAPVISNFSPAIGAEGTWVGIHGCYFGNTKGRVLYNTSLPGAWPDPAICGSNTWTNTQIISEVPTGAASGPLQVERAPSNPGQVTSTSNFTVSASVNPPGLCRVNPSTVSQPQLADPAYPVALSGKGYGAAFSNAVKVNYYPQGSASANVVTPNSAGWTNTQISSLTPAGLAVGNGLVSVKNGTDESGAVEFNVTSVSTLGPPQITDMDPKDGFALTSTATTVVKITGQNFGSSGTVYFGTTAAPIASCGHWSNNEIVVVVPAGVTGTLPVKVVTATGSVSKYPDNTNVQFTVNTTIRPGICSLSPDHGAGGTRVTIVGRNFGNSSATGTVKFPVYVNVSGSWVPNFINLNATSNSALVKGWSNTSISIVAPAADANQQVRTGDVTVSVTPPTGYSAVDSNGVTFTGDPFISSIMPATGPAGTWVTVRGGNFGAQAGQVTFGGGPSDALPGVCGKPWKDTEVVVAAPDQADSTALVRIVTAVGKITADADSKNFKFDHSLPVPPGICKLQPDSAPPFGGATVYGQLFGEDQPSVQGQVNWPSSGTLHPAAAPWTDATIGLTIPADSTTGDVTVQKRIKTGTTCNGLSLGGICLGTTQGVYSTLTSNPWKFKVGNTTTPLAPLTITSWSPAMGDSQVCRNAVLEIHFNKPVNPASVGTNSIGLLSGMTTISGTVIVNNSNPTDPKIVFTPTTPMNPSVINQFTVNTFLKGTDGSTLSCAQSVNHTCATQFNTGGDVCQLDRVSVTPNAYSFNSSGQQQEFEAAAFSPPTPGFPQGQQLAATYTWKEPTGLVSIAASTVNPANGEAVTAGGKNGKATLTVTATATASGTVIGTKSASAALDVYLCELPWELDDTDFDFHMQYCRAQQIPLGSNLVSANSEFDSAAGITDSWSLLPNTSTAWQQNLVAGYADTSSASVNAVWGADKNALVRQLPLTSGTQYVAEAYVNNPSSNTAAGYLYVSNTASCFLGTNPYTVSHSAPGWQHLQVAFTAGSSEYLCLFIANGSVTNPVLFDHVSVKAITDVSSVLPELGNRTNHTDYTGPDLRREYFLPNTQESDAVGLRIYKVGMSLVSPRAWYASRTDIVKGNPTDTVVDGYPAIRDGNTTYVVATNLAPGAPASLSTYVSVLSFNTGAHPSTQTIYQALVKGWIFNTNLPDDTGGRGGRADEQKLWIQRDLRRLTDVRSIQQSISRYSVGHQNTVPQLASGSYEVGHSTSKWYSWQQTLGSALGTSVPVDPVNTFGTDDVCTSANGYDTSTCWNASSKKFDCPAGSHIYQYCRGTISNSQCTDTGNKAQASLAFNAEFKDVKWWTGTVDEFVVPAGDACDGWNQSGDYTLTKLSLTVDGNGTVASNPAGINCTSSSTSGCVAQYKGGTVTLTAVANPGTQFDSWVVTPAANGSGCTATTCTVNLNNGMTSVTAKFIGISYQVTVAIDGPASSGSVVGLGLNCPGVCNENVQSGNSLQLVANPQSGYSFVGWTGAGCGGVGFCTVKVTNSSQKVTAKFVPLVHLNLTTAGSGTGTVVASPQGVDCSTGAPSPTGNCYASGTTVMITAAPSGTYVFNGWSGDCSGSNTTCTFGLSQDANVVASFGKPGYVVTVKLAGSGTGTVASNDTPQLITCGTDCTGTYEAGSTVRLTALANTDSSFSSWAGAPVSACSANICNLTVDSPLTLTATFGPQAYTLTVNNHAAGNGAVTSSEASPLINCGTTCSANYTRAATVVLHATPSSAAYVFTGWTNAPGCGGNASCTITMNGNTSVDANFVPAAKLTVSTVSQWSNGSGTVTSDKPASTPIKCGTGGANCIQYYQKSPADVVTLTATPDAGSLFVTWDVSAYQLPDTTWVCGTDTRCVLTMSFDRSVAARFEKKAILTVANLGSGGGTVKGTGTWPSQIDCGFGCVVDYPQKDPSYGNVTLTATPDPTSAFTGWNVSPAVNANCPGLTPTCVVTMNSTTSVTATFVPAYHLTVSKIYNSAASTTDGLTSSPIGLSCNTGCPAAPATSVTGNFTSGTTVTLMASADAGHIFKKWSGSGAGACAGTTAPCSVLMSSDKSITAEFGPAPSALLQVNPSGNGSGSVVSNPSGINCNWSGSTISGDCVGSFQTLTTVVLQAQPTLGTVSWQDANGNTMCGGSSSCGIFIPDTNTVIVKTIFTAVPLTVTVNGGANGYGMGSVVSNVGGINCSSGSVVGCSAAFNQTPATTVTLTATPTKGVFTRWTGVTCTEGNNTTAQCTFVMDSAKSVVAVFTAAVLDLTLTGSGSGTVDISPPGSTCGSALCQQVYDPGTVVTLTASPASGSTFGGWTGCTAGGNPLVCTVQMNSDTSISANFSSGPTYTVTITKSGTGAAASSVTVSPSQPSFVSGTLVTLAAVPGVNVFFTGWVGGVPCSGVVNPCTFTITNNVGGQATFLAQAAPGVHTTAASLLTPTSAQANGIVNTNGLATVAWFRWGTSNSACAALPNQTTSSPFPGVFGTNNLGVVINGLAPSTTYYYCAMAQNSVGTSTAPEVLSFTTLPPSTNVVVDGDFESVIDATNWHPGATSGCTYTDLNNAVVSTPVQSGAKAYKLICAINQPLALHNGQTYTVRFWYSGGGGFDLKVVDNMTGTNAVFVWNLTPTAAWQQYTQTFTAQSSNYSVYFDVGGGTVYVDNLSIQ